jgi:hypothetical protein
VAIGFAGLLSFVAAYVPTLFGVSEFDGQGYFGTLCSFGFLSVYILISVAAPVYLKKIEQLTYRAIVVAGAGAIFMVIPFVGVIGLPGSSLFPPPSFPNNILVYIFIAYMLLGGAWLLTLRRRRPNSIEEVFED